MVRALTYGSYPIPRAPRHPPCPRRFLSVGCHADGAGCLGDRSLAFRLPNVPHAVAAQAASSCDGRRFSLARGVEHRRYLRASMNGEATPSPQPSPPNGGEGE